MTQTRLYNSYVLDLGLVLGTSLILFNKYLLCLELWHLSLFQN